MANTFSQIYLQFVFAVKGRNSLIRKENKFELHNYIIGLAENRKAKMLSINSMPDHIHLFVGFNPSVLISDFVKEIKIESHELIDKKKWAQGFAWQTGYGAFSYSRSDIDKVCKYIQNQEEHHRHKSFNIEYIELLQEFGLPYDERYLFEWIK
jgi:putative transposase